MLEELGHWLVGNEAVLCGSPSAVSHFLVSLLHDKQELDNYPIVHLKDVLTHEVCRT